MAAHFRTDRDVALAAVALERCTQTAARPVARPGRAASTPGAPSPAPEPTAGDAHPDTGADALRPVPPPPSGPEGPSAAGGTS